MNVTSLLARLNRWSLFAERHWAHGRGQDEGYFGTGYNSWGVQTNQKYAGVMAALATLGDGAAGVDRQWALNRAQAALHFSLNSHVSGAGCCADGTRWGHTWISVLGIERMMYGVNRLGPQLDGMEQAALRRVLTSEADWLAEKYERYGVSGVVGGQWNESLRNAPESNLWNGAFLWRTAEMYPDHPRQEAWRERARLFLANGVSVPSDEKDDRMMDGQRIRDRFRGANFFDNYALDHHGYLNVGYMIICASHAAMLHFDLKSLGLPGPASLHHHQADLWRVVRRMLFSNGRLARIGGDGRVRYAYCQEYLLPALLYAADHLGDVHAPGLAEAFWKLIQQEDAGNDDGSFYGKRLAELATANPYYYTRLESDRACALAMAACYLPMVSRDIAPPVSFEQSVAGAWCEPEHGAVVHRSPRRLASFVWRSHGLTQGMCQPPDDGHLAEWPQNLAGKIVLLGTRDIHTSPEPPRRLVNYQVETFDGGFVTSGTVIEGACLLVLEGWTARDAATSHLAIAALPDARTMIGMHRCRTADWRVCWTEIQGIHLNLPNDLFNGFRRRLFSEKGETVLTAPAEQDSVVSLGGRWVNIENRLGLAGLYGASEMAVHRSHQRLGGRCHSLYVEEIASPCLRGPHWAEPNEVILDVVWAVLSGASAEETRRFQWQHPQAAIDTGLDEVRAVRVTGADDRTYIMAANFSDQPICLAVQSLLAGNAGGAVLTTGARLNPRSAERELHMQAGQSVLIQED